ncbi:hypothetical protein [Aurantiacibacter suaedae]|nr:hypothetical protein [Aurantiacibacter suaedae]
MSAPPRLALAAMQSFTSFASTDDDREPLCEIFTKIAEKLADFVIS